MQKSNVASDTLSAKTHVQRSEKIHHFCRASSNRRITLSATGDIKQFLHHQCVIA
jgi:hypothetical protein